MDLKEEIRKGHKQALAKAITLVCSHLASDQKKAASLLQSLLVDRTKTSYRIGVSGIGGVGKSTFIGVLGEFVLQKKTKDKVAVLTIDPSSPKAGGSLLGDGLRMGQLSSHERVFVRAIANQGISGAVSLQAQEIVLLLEAAGFDWIFIESVGAGQSDHSIAYLCDLFLSLQMPASGDAIQALKKGSSELADIIVIHKCDGVLKLEAEKMKAYYTQAQSLQKATQSLDFPEVSLVSSMEKLGIENLWQLILKKKSEQEVSGFFAKNRQEQLFKVFKEQLALVFQTEVFTNPLYKGELAAAKKSLVTGESSPLLEARVFVNKILGP